ncbi:MAG: EAL domain-containing protein [Rhizobiales bacterium]|nr:EAL domain-containing protein [Hyphomicrobiales bacterium]MBI3672154.1 EAL domain-containing protein [Hyphomicrobiales bacterium]
MQRQDWPAVLGLMLFAALAAGFAAAMLAANWQQNLIPAGAVLVLAAGQMAALFAQGARYRKLASRLASQGRSFDTMAEGAADTAARLERIEQQLTRPAARSPDDILQEVRALRDSVQTLAKDMAQPPKPAAERAPPRANPVPPPPQERLDLLLEPLIELATGVTVHYRARVNMADEHGSEVVHDELMAKANGGGLRPALDVHLLRLTLPVLRRLQVKHPAMRVMVPLSGATLRAAADVGRLTAALEAEADAAAGIVFEIAQADLAQLDRAGIEGLAKLGRLGATLALCEVSVAGLDLAALRQLGARFLTIDGHSIDAGFGVSSAWTEFARFARAMQFQIIVGGVRSTVEAQAAARVARYASGPYFAPPRRVRQDAGREASNFARSRAA